MRQPIQVLVIPFRLVEERLEVCLFKTNYKSPYWQFVAGGAENDETPIRAAERELKEEAGIESNSLTSLELKTMVPVENISGFLWGEDLLYATEYTFAIKLNHSQKIKISAEHLEFKWFSYKQAIKALNWDSNKSALWELNYKSQKGFL